MLREIKIWKWSCSIEYSWRDHHIQIYHFKYYLSLCILYYRRTGDWRDHAYMIPASLQSYFPLFWIFPSPPELLLTLYCLSSSLLYSTSFCVHLSLFPPSFHHFLSFLSPSLFCISLISSRSIRSLQSGLKFFGKVSRPDTMLRHITAWSMSGMWKQMKESEEREQKRKGDKKRDVMTVKTFLILPYEVFCWYRVHTLFLLPHTVARTWWICKWAETCLHLVHQHTKSPVVDCFVMTPAQHQLRSKILRGATESVSLAATWYYLGR